MYYPYFIIYMLIGLTISAVVLAWAMKTGQFTDQSRARFLPLADEPADSRPGGKRVSRLNRYEAYGLLALVIAGLAASGAVLVFSLIHSG